MELTRGEYADRRETSDRVYDILDELRRDRERHHKRRADGLIVISPTIDAQARTVAARLGIETDVDSTDVESI